MLFLKKLDNNDLILLLYFLGKAGVSHNNFLMASVNAEIEWRRKVGEMEEKENET